MICIRCQTVRPAKGVQSDMWNSCHGNTTCQTQAKNCLVAIKEAAMQDIQIAGLTEKEYEMVRRENVLDVLFQALLLDDMKQDAEKIYVEFLTVYCG